MAMTKDQRKYLEKRVDEIFDKRKKDVAVRLALKKDTKDVTISLAKLIKAVPAVGNFNVQVSRENWSAAADVTLNTYELEKLISDADLKKLGMTPYQEKEANDRLIEAEQDKIDAEKTRVKDKLFLGDAEDALKMIQDLEKGL